VPTSNQLRTLLALAVVAWAIVLILQGQSVSPALLSPFSYVLSVLTLGVIFWERWVWAWRVSYFFRLNKHPDLRGTWKGVVVSDWVDKESKRGRGPIEVYLVIRQTYTTIDVRLFSEESSSVSLSGNIFSDSGDVWALAVTYRSTPRILKRDGSPMSHGGTLLSVIGAPVHKLDGEYWTDQNRKGAATFTNHSKAIFHDFEDAARGLNSVS